MDFVILRAVLQHLPDSARLMRHLPELLRPGGVVLFLDTTRENFVESEPPLPAFDAFYRPGRRIAKVTVACAATPRRSG